MNTQGQRESDRLDRIEAKLDLLAAAIGGDTLKSNVARLGFGARTPQWVRRRFRKALREAEAPKEAGDA
jgi:hypothetical protein